MQYYQYSKLQRIRQFEKHSATALLLAAQTKFDHLKLFQFSSLFYTQIYDNLAINDLLFIRQIFRMMMDFPVYSSDLQLLNDLQLGSGTVRIGKQKYINIIVKHSNKNKLKHSNKISQKVPNHSMFLAKAISLE
ncbi:Hypothetical_protein [Hexamita inflata]|uniref:Hypothetical_protein n=1 Tax=Hexamita inflata TaxID=28002 RepID=A0ABP1HQY0_9EUKA